VLIVGLAFAITSRLPAPYINPAPGNETAVNYSAFLRQVKLGNVRAVIIKGSGLNALLAEPLAATSAAVVRDEKSNNFATTYAVWRQSLGDESTLVADGSSDAIDPAQALYTQLPTPGDAALLPLLLGKHVTISTIPAPQTAFWQGLFMHLLPFAFLLLLLLCWLASRNVSRFSRPSVDNKITLLGKNRVRRFERTKETSSVSPAKSPAQAHNGGGAPGRVGRIDPPVTFADVAGIDEVRSELEEIVQFLRSPERFRRLGARIPRGALLVGAPGTGKTLLAKAVAGEADVPFFSISASEFVEMFVGVGASRVRDLFNQARQSAPCVIFIDEIDAVGRKRSMRITGNDERDQTLNQLLVELDGFDARQAVVVLAATNRVDILDNALLRPGRFDRCITVSPPTRLGREAILRVHTRKTPLASCVSLERLSRMTTGMTGADLANLVNEAALSAARRNLEAVTHECFEEALARVQLGALRPIVMSERERRIIAYHEGGHALVAYHLPEADTVNRVTILPRGQSLGVTQFIAEEDRYNYSRETLMARIAVGLGGRVAEELTFGAQRVTTGAENDLQVVTDLAHRMVTRWGMSKQVGVVFTDYRAEGGYSLNMRRVQPAQSHTLIVDEQGYLQSNESDLTHQQVSSAVAAVAQHTGSVAMGALSVAMGALIDAEVQHILHEGYAMARTILMEHADQLTLLATQLLEHEQLDRTQFSALFAEK
jgi:cell division protease FtsH